MGIIQKIIIPLFFILLMFTQAKVTFAAESDWIGLFDDPEVYKGPIDNLIDNNPYSGIYGESFVVSYILEVPVTIESVRYNFSGSSNVSNKGGSCTMNVSLKNEDKVSVGAVGESLSFNAVRPSNSTEKLKDKLASNVKYVDVTGYCNNARIGGHEVEIFGKKEKYEGVTDVVVSNIKDTTAEITYKNPEHDQLVENQILLNGNEVYSGEIVERFNLSNLQPLTEYKVSIIAIYENGTKVLAEKVFTTNEKVSENPVDVTDVHWTIEGNRLKLTYVKDPSVDYVNIYRDGKLVSEKNTSNEYIDKDIKVNSKYEYLIVSYNAFGKTLGVKVDVQIPNKEVSNLVASSKEKEVSLTWEMPSYTELDFARVYRAKGDVSMFTRLFKSKSTYEPIFETNGTSFKDLTVQADTEYKYKITTVDMNGNETDGKIVTVKTKKITVNGGGIEKDDNGDFVITWTSPTTGKIKVLVGGVEYAIVSAADKKIVIPKDKMKFDSIGKPDVQLIPVDENGNEGIPSKPGGGGGGFGDIIGGGAIADVLNPGNLLKVGVQLLAVIGGFVLLGLAFRVVPKLVRTIRTAFTASSNQQINKRRVQD